MKTCKYILVIFLAMVLGNCTTSSTNKETDSTPWEPLLQQGQSLPETVPPVEMTLDLKKTEVSAGESLELAFDLQNMSEEDTLLLKISFSGRHDFVVLDEDSNIVWNRLPDFQTLAQSGIYFTPGQIRTYSHAWDLKDESGNPVPKGTYYVFGGFTGIEYTNPDQNEEFEGPAATEMQKITIE